MKKILLTLLVFCFNLPVFANSEVITVIADSHVSINKKDEQAATPATLRLLQTISQVNKDSSNCVIFLGDNVNSPNRLNVALFAKAINKIKKPVYVVAGNRDIGKKGGLDQKEYYRIVNKFSKNKVKKAPSYIKHDDLIFIFMYGVNETVPTFRGNYRTSELEFLNKTLTKFSDKKAIIFQHFPIVPPKEDIDKTPYKPEMYLAELQKHNNVLAVVSGHYHFENVIEQAGIKHISVASLALNGEYEQLKIFKNNDGSYSVTTKIIEAD